MSSVGEADMRRTWATAAVSAVAVALVAVGTLVIVSGDDDAPYRDDSTMMAAGGRSPASSDHAADAFQGWSSGMSSMHDTSAATSEYAYLAAMVAHHREAIAAALQLSRSGRSQMRDFGARAVDTQSEQVKQMTAWIREWYPGRPTFDAGYMPEMRDLSRLSGDQLDRAFLNDMIPHHMVAVMMSQRFLAGPAAKHRQAARLASRISSAQHAEIVQMLGWSRAWFAEQPLAGMTGPMMLW